MKGHIEIDGQKRCHKCDYYEPIDMTIFTSPSRKSNQYAKCNHPNFKIDDYDGRGNLLFNDLTPENCLYIQRKKKIEHLIKISDSQ